MSNNNHMPWLQRVIEDHQGKALWKDVIQHQQVDMIVYLNNDLLSSQISYLQTLSQIFTIVIAAILLNRISKSSLADSSVKRKMDVFSLRILQKMSTLSIGFISFWIIIGLFLDSEYIESQRKPKT